MQGPSGKLAFNILHFARVLREAGLPVGPNAVLDALDAAQLGTLTKRDDFYWTLHAIFVKRREQHELFEQAFHVFWKKPKMLQQLMQLFMQQVSRKADDKKKQAGFRRLAEAMFEQQEVPSVQKAKHDEIEIDATFTASAEEILRAKDFEQMTTAEQAQAKVAIARLRLHRLEVPTRRFRPSHRGHRPDMRRLMRNTLRGDQFELPMKARASREPPLVVLCDISGSCSQYSRMFLHFLHALSSDRDRIHVFLFGTRLTHVTRDLKRRDVDEAVDRVSKAVKDWSGGTRIATTLHDFNFKWGRRVLGQGAHVLLMSDGLERGDCAQLAQEMQRLRKSSKRIVWLNPLLRFEKFEALAEGVKAMMPHVDEFRPVHSLDSLKDIAASLASPRKAQHDPKVWMERAHGHA